ncbi:MAG: hypothetical protein MUC48_07695 [Leptolyngbya sp. Prado105]|jgi:hypothetical protein|nr:hypothetical protein [Leptolyngbya sp. Prado105]
MIRSPLLRHCYLSQPQTLICGGLVVVVQQPSGSNPVATVLWQVLGNPNRHLGAEIIRSDRRIEIYISDEKFNLDQNHSGWRCRRTPM